ncbi:MAG: hypothetical protein K5753_04485 [Clostridia bacterium]|nr:hypothetical protein [Clostridia bacterium]
MKKIVILLIAVAALICLFAACEEGGGAKVEITTSKSGTINVSVFAQDVPADKQDKANTLTPTVTLNEKQITDDGKGLYRINFDTSGEGTVSVDSTTVQTGAFVTAQAGTTVTVNVAPANEWKLNVCMLDWEVVESSTFVMPDHDVTFLVSFVSKRHSVSLGGSGGRYIITERSDAVEGTTVEFSINEADLSTDGWYYEDEDVFVESSVEDEMGNRERVNVQKVGENRFRFVMPTFDCNIVMNRRDFGKVAGVYFSKRNANDQLDQIYENEIANYITYTLTMDNETIELNTRIKRHVATLNITYLNPLYEVEDVRWDSRTNSTTKVDDRHYTFTVGYSHLLVILKDKEVPSGSHAITVNNPEHGTIAADKAYAEAGETVTVTVTPDENYHLATLQYSYETDVWNDIAEQNGAYVFTMPDADVTLRATFDNTPVTSGNLHIYVQGLVGDENEYSLSGVFSEIRWVDSKENQEIIREIPDSMTVPVEIGTLNFWYWINEEYQCLGVYFRNNNVLTADYGDYGRAEFDVQEGDLNGNLVFVVALK